MNREKLITLASTPADYVGVDAADLRALFEAKPQHAQGPSWLAANGSKVGMIRIARATLRGLLDMELEKPTGDQYPSTALVRAGVPPLGGLVSQPQAEPTEVGTPAQAEPTKVGTLAQFKPE